MLSDADKAAMRQRHRSDMGHLLDGDSGVPVCPKCRTLWPCDAERLLDALGEAERAYYIIRADRTRLALMLARVRNPSDEVVEAVSAAFARTAAENSELHFEADRTFELAWKGEARAAIAALADALGVGTP